MDLYVVVVIIVRVGSIEACFEVILKEFRFVIFFRVSVFFFLGVV